MKPLLSVLLVCALATATPPDPKQFQKLLKDDNVKLKDLVEAHLVKHAFPNKDRKILLPLNYYSQDLIKGLIVADFTAQEKGEDKTFPCSAVIFLRSPVIPPPPHHPYQHTKYLMFEPTKDMACVKVRDLPMC